VDDPRGDRARPCGGAKLGLCDEAPGNDPAFARKLVAYGIDSISVTPDAFAAVKANLAAAGRG
jgi:pyruvate,water dikinase